jgi:hypothetical protein
VVWLPLESLHQPFFCDDFIYIGFCKLFAPVWLCTIILISAFWVAWIIGMSHQCLACIILSFFFIHLFIDAYIVWFISPPCPPILSLKMLLNVLLHRGRDGYLACFPMVPCTRSHGGSCGLCGWDLSPADDAPSAFISVPWTLKVEVRSKGMHILNDPSLQSCFPPAMSGQVGCCPASSIPGPGSLSLRNFL